MNSEYNLIEKMLTIREHFILNRTMEVQASEGFLQNVLQFNPSLPVYDINWAYAGAISVYPNRQNPVANQNLYDSFDVFYKKTTGILVEMVGIAAMGEGSTQWINAGEMKNIGFELNLSYCNKISFGLKYDLNANLFSYRNKITALSSSVMANGMFGGNGIKSVIGYAIDSQVGYVADGIFKSQDEVDNHAKQEGVSVGRILWRDIDKNGVIDEKDQQWIYDPTPSFSYGLYIYLQYRNFDFTMFWQGVQDIDIISDLKKETDLWSGLNIGFLNKSKRVLDAWTPANPNSNISALSRSDLNNEKRVSTYFVEKESFLKLLMYN